MFVVVVVKTTNQKGYPPTKDKLDSFGAGLNSGNPPTKICFGSLVAWDQGTCTFLSRVIGGPWVRNSLVILEALEIDNFITGS